MPDDVNTLVAELQAIVDVDDTAALRLLNRRHRQMVARAQTYKASIEIVMIGGVDNTDIPEVPIEVHNVTVDGAQYTQGRLSDSYQYGQGLLVFTGPGLFVPSSSFGTQRVTLVPPPSDTVVLDLFCSMPAPDLVAGGDETTIRVDGDMIDPLVEGAAATELLRIGEGDPVSLEAKFTAACEELRVRERRRMRGAGPAQIRIIGVNA